MIAQSIEPIKFKTYLKGLSWKILDTIDEGIIQKMFLNI